MLQAAAGKIIHIISAFGPGIKKERKSAKRVPMPGGQNK